ncbi:hypothetical protein HYU13_03865 [Candidatus Woesearchaeota archaeon]|nr:hypothetical protein [Candidatus Woesearchaeota archaeon]
MDSFMGRENEIFDILQSFNRSGLPFVLIGGYAVSAYAHRFSIDADVCIDKHDITAFKDILKAKQFVLNKEKEIGDSYRGRFACYVKKAKLPVTVDLLIGSVASRQTSGSISYATLYANSVIKKIAGIEKEIIARIPKKELLIALKVHSARLTDARDIVALCHNIDFDSVAGFMHTGNQEKIQDNLDTLISFFNSPQLKDSFKGVFSIEKLPRDNLHNAIALVNSLKMLST